MPGMAGRRVRIKPGVRPYGGRLADLVAYYTYPNGRAVVRVIAPKPHRGGWMHVDIREYRPDEIQEL